MMHWIQMWFIHLALFGYCKRLLARKLVRKSVLLFRTHSVREKYCVRPKNLDSQKWCFWTFLSPESHPKAFWSNFGVCMYNVVRCPLYVVRCTLYVVRLQNISRTRHRIDSGDEPKFSAWPRIDSIKFWAWSVQPFGLAVLMSGHSYHFSYKIDENRQFSEVPKLPNGSTDRLHFDTISWPRRVLQPGNTHGPFGSPSERTPQ